MIHFHCSLFFVVKFIFYLPKQNKTKPKNKIIYNNKLGIDFVNQKSNNVIAVFFVVVFAF